MRRHLYFYTHVEADLEHASAAFCADPGLWLPPPATPAEDRWVVELSAEGALPRPLSRHRVVVDVGAPITSGNRVLRPITWRSATTPGIFPVFEGDLEMSGLQGNLCQLSLMGSYRPPLSVAGTAADAMLGHNVAEACVRRFVLDIAARMVAGVTLDA